MAYTNDMIENPVIGDKVQFLITSEDSKGEILKTKLWLKIGAKGTPEHVHPKQLETFEVISGTARIKLSGEDLILTAGQKIEIPKNAPHKFSNAGDDELIMIGELMPAMRTEFFIETMYAVAIKGKVNSEAIPTDFFQFMTILNEYYGEVFIVGIPIPIQKIVTKVVGGIGKVFGYKGFISCKG
ncbi:MAG: cupin domain-containing protein [Aquaticitalea sp.]